MTTGNTQVDSNRVHPRNILRDHLSLLDYETFCIHNLRFKPAPEHIQIAKSFDEYNFLLVMMARQSGKTQTVSSKTLHYALTNANKKVLIFAPAKDQAVELLFGRIKNWIEGSEFLTEFVKDGTQGMKKLFSDYVEFKN